MSPDRVSAFHRPPRMERLTSRTTSPANQEHMMKRLTITPAGVVLLAALAGACNGEAPSAAAPTDPELARAPVGYTALDVGALIGDYTSQAMGVNDDGDVAGVYCCDPNTRVFVALGSGPVVTMPGFAYGISNGSPAYVAGSSGGAPVRWSVDDPTQPLLLELTAAEVTAESFGAARGVNTAGATVGNVGLNPAMWAADGSRVLNPIAIPAGYGKGEGRGINDDGLAVFQFVVAGGSETAVSRAYLRLASGTPIELPPEAGDVTTYVNDISEVVLGAVHIAGSTRSSDLVSRSVRWTVNASSGEILATAVLPRTGSHGLGASDAGGIAGFIDRRQGFESYLWRGTEVLKLGAPKGGNNPRAWAMSRSGEYVAGLAYFRQRSSAVRWTIATP